MARGNALNHRHLELYEPDPVSFFPREEETRGARVGRALRAIGRRWWLVLLCATVTTAAAWFLVPSTAGFRQATAVVRAGDVRPPNAADLGLPADIVDVTAMLAQAHIIRGEGLVGEVVDANALRLWPSTDLPFYLFRNVEINAGLAAADTLAFTFQDAGFRVSSASSGLVNGRYGQPVVAGGVGFVLESRPVGVEYATASLLPRREAIERVLARLSAEPRPETDILDISYRDPDEDRALLVANAMARVYEDYAIRTAMGGSGRSRLLEIEGRLAEAEAEVVRIQELLQVYRDAGADLAQRRLQVEQVSLNTLQGRLRRLNDERRPHADFLARVEGAGTDRVDAEIATLMAFPAVSANPNFAPLFSELNAQRLEHARLRATGLTETDPDVARLTRAISTARNAIIRAATDELARINADLASANSQLNGMMASAQANPVVGGDEESLRRELSAAQTTLAAIRNEHQVARLGASGPGQPGILDLATYTTDATLLDRYSVLGLALLLGVMLGSGGALVLEARDTSVRTRPEMEALLKAPGLAVIPRIPGGQKDVRADSRDLKSYTPVLTGTEASMAVSPELREFHSLAAEAYRMLRTNLIFLRTDQALRSLVVTSAGMGDGKTTTAVNLAVAFARQGKRVLLVDCDLRRPRLHTFFDMLVGPGLTEVILGTEKPEAVIRQTAIENLSLLSRGAFDERAGEMLSGPQGRRVIQSLRERCELLILDTSPTLLTADAAAVAPHVDGVLLVARAGRTPREAARQAAAQVRVVGATVLGFVLNDPDGYGQRYGEGKYTKEYYTVEV